MPSCFSRAALPQWLLCGAIALAALAARAESPGILVGLDERGRIVVERVDVDALDHSKLPRGLIVSPGAEGSDQRMWIEGGQATRLAAATRSLSSVSTSASAGPTGSGEMQLLATTLQLPPLFTPPIPRGAPLLTPVNNSTLLTQRPIFRRMPEAKGEKFPAARGVLYDANQREVLKLAFAAGQQEARYDDQKPPLALAAGLPPGRYLVKLAGGLDEVQFTVLDEAGRQSLTAALREFPSPAAGPRDPIALQYAVERLLAETPPTGPPKHLADAYDLLAAESDALLTPYLRALRGELRTWLERLTTDANYRPQVVGGVAIGAETGVGEIDVARALLSAGHWTAAEQKLAAIRPGVDAAGKRKAGLAALYRASILTEAGLSRREEAAQAFAEAVAALADSSGGDLFRARNNRANYLLRQADEQLHNHAFLMAAGVQHPLSAALESWLAAREEYAAAALLAEKLSADDRAAVQLNVARLYVQLADLIATLDAPIAGQRRFASGEKAAAAQADQAAAGIESIAQAAPLTRAAAAEIRAHLAQRAGAFELCQTHAAHARGFYAEMGYLVGVESVERLLGLASESRGDREAALVHFEQAHLLAELLRSHFPKDRVGLTRAGFFARRSYVFEKLIDLSLAAGRPQQALRYAELAKARAAQDLLATAGVGEEQASPARPRDLAAILASWPKEMAALEYYLGSERAWVFLVRPDGTVAAGVLKSADGRPLAPRELIGRVRKFLSEMEFTAAKMSQRVLSDQGFDHAWQDALHQFHGELLPADIAAELKSAKQVLVVPHHILHYFPFAALVVERDRAERAANEMVSPKFLLDEPYHLLYAPSLTIWDMLRQTPPRPITRALALGIVEAPGAPRLEGVEQDLASFREVFGARVKRVLAGSEGTEGAVKKLLAEPGLLLIATHGINAPDQPLESHLLLMPDGAAGAADGDGQLTAREIYETKVRASMIVMSACYSGLGDRSPLAGDDLFGLQRAFLQSGARTVVSGLWDVFDGTAPGLVRGYFERVGAGEPAGRALAESQRAFLAKHRGDKADSFVHPYFWAVYTVAGEDSVPLK